MPTEERLRECQERVLQLAPDTGKHCALYDALEMNAPDVKVAWSQRKLDEKAPLKLRRAIVLPNTKLAYMARLASGGGDYRVFYSDISAGSSGSIRSSFEGPTLRLGGSQAGPEA